MNELVSETWVPTEHDRRLFIQAGVKADRIAVVPHGVDPTVFHPEAEPLALGTDSLIKFLYVGGGLWRKGFDVILRAYTSIFRKSDSVALVVRDYGAPAFPDLAIAIKSAMEDPQCPKIVYLDRFLSAAEMASLYTACTCLVHPYRVEAFALPVAEAMACGLPVMVTGYGACLDYCSSSTALLLPATVHRSEEIRIGDLALNGPVEWAEVSVDELAVAMREFTVDPQRVKVRARLASKMVRTELTWGRAAEIAVARLKMLCGVDSPPSQSVQESSI